MADTKISAMSAAAAATASTVPVVQGGVNKKVSMTGAGAAMIEAADAAAQAALLTALLAKAGGTMTGALINSANGAASAPAVSVTGAPFSGGSASTTKPLYLIETAGATSAAWNTNGTMFGINAPSGFAGSLCSFQLNGSERLSIKNDGSIDNRTLTSYVLTGNSSAWMGEFGGAAGVSITSAGQYYFSSSNVVGGSRDAGLVRTGSAALKVTNGTTGRGSLDASAYLVGGVAGANFGPGLPTSITVVNGIITAAS